MNLPVAVRSIALAGALLMGASCGFCAQAGNGKAAPSSDEELKFVVIITRHGVRSPTSKPDQLNQYSAQPWPTWNVPPGYLTEHGAKLMQLFGAYDRQLMVSQQLLSANGCEDSAHITIIADSDQRTRETGNALAAGLMPGCKVSVEAFPEGTPDPLFHPKRTDGKFGDKGIAAATISGRIGNNPAGLTEAYRPQLEALEEVLLGCMPRVPCAVPPGKKSVFDVPSSVEPGKGDHLAELHSPLGTAATLAENILLEYTNGMELSQVGWGRVDANRLRELMQLHTANEDLAQRTPYIASAQSSNLLTHVLASMQQAASGNNVEGALSKPEDRLLIVVGHDTNLANISGALNLSWLIDGRLNDTPPGGALSFELWQKRGTQEQAVRVYYTAQTLDQMRNATPLDLKNPPERVAVFVPGCSRADASCDWTAFERSVQTVTK